MSKYLKLFRADSAIMLRKSEIRSVRRYHDDRVVIQTRDGQQIYLSQDEYPDGLSIEKLAEYLMGDEAPGGERAMKQGLIDEIAKRLEVSTDEKLLRIILRMLS